MNENILIIIEKIFSICILPILGILTTYLIKWINVKMFEVRSQTENKKLQKYTAMLTETITSCVIATNQTYVETLKEQGKFDIEAQKEAFKKTSQAVLNILSSDAKEYLSFAVGDLEDYISKKIEAEVNLNKIK